jgi:hypothetical protein
MALQQIRNVRMSYFLILILSFSVRKLVEKLRKKLFFNPFFRTHMKSYIKFNLTAMIALSAVSHYILNNPL